ncbi:hypothetical protein SAMN06265218_108113 [Fodinibius sediminis]|uniref:Uncharacterized protein n=1 Tax=Fodinibius sediminis TaxID=1214077 RepID=A0A521D438_9BACT|nr:hypothetical protein SAMN06265218_108113 [Fodinibius sediminis]
MILHNPKDDCKAILFFLNRTSEFRSVGYTLSHICRTQ